MDGGSTTHEHSSQPTVPQTTAETFGMSRHFAAIQAHHAQEVESNNPRAELDCYLSNPLEQHGTDMLHFWMVSAEHNILIFYINHRLCRTKVQYTPYSEQLPEISSPFQDHRSLVRGHFLVQNTQTPIVETIFHRCT